MVFATTRNNFPVFAIFIRVSFKISGNTVCLRKDFFVGFVIFDYEKDNVGDKNMQ